MMAINSLLNPVEGAVPGRTLAGLASRSGEASPAESGSHPPLKKQKMAKDAAVFTKGKISGEVRYPPFETLEPQTMQEVQKFNVYPLGHISEFRRHIPYNSDKKNFLQRTGRGAFEVFQYTFHRLEDGAEFTIMWDYNVGLVRITPFFKCCNYAKTMPSKMLAANPGLRDISHSITGGALAAQGYWMPFESARAVAATFCWSIRYALVPLFGPDFVTLCKKEGSEHFGHMAIDPKIVRQCALDAQAYHELYAQQRRPRALESTLQWHRQSGHPISPADSEADCTVDGDHRRSYADSPTSSYSCHWSPQTPRSMRDDMLLPSPRQLLPVVAPPTASGDSEPCHSPKAGPLAHRRSYTQDPGQLLASISKKLDGTNASLKGRVLERRSENRDSKPSPEISNRAHNKETAAYLLMQLYLADTGPNPKTHEAGPKKRRASG